MSTPITTDGMALSLRHVTKAFGSDAEGPMWRRFQQRVRPKAGNGHGDKPNGNGHDKRKIAVDDVSVDVHRHEIFGILGPNGSGKSTLIRLIATLLVPDGGQIQVFGLDVSRQEMEVKRLINRVSVDAAFFKRLSSIENLMYAGRLYGLSGADARRQSMAILHRLGLKDKEILGPVEDMSRGMQQKVAIARAFLSRPQLLLLDEPTTGLDPRSKHEVQAFVRELRDTHDATIVLTTHDMAEAEALCDRIAIIDDGRIVALDTPDGLKRLVPQHDGAEPSLEDVFMTLTGKALIKEEDQVTS